MITRFRFLVPPAVLAAALCAFAPAAQAQSADDGIAALTGEFELHSLDGLEEMAGDGPISLPPVLGTFNLGVTVPVDRRLDVGGETMWRAGYQIAPGFYLGGGFGMIVLEGEPFRALPEGTLTQFQGHVALDWVLPLRPSSDPYGRAPALKLGFSPGFIGGDFDPSRADQETLSELNQSLDTAIWGGVARFEVGFDLPILEMDNRSLFLSFGLSYQWGLAQVRYKLRDKDGPNPTIDDEENIRLDSFSAWIGFTARF